MKKQASAILLVTASGLALVSGCDRRSETARAVEHSSNEVQALNAGGSIPAPTETRQKSYSQVASDMQQAASSGSGGEKAAALVLASSAQNGLAEIPAAEAVHLEGQVHDHVLLMSASLQRWNSSNAVAEAAEAYDASSQLADIAKSRGEKDQNIKTETARREELAKRIDGLRAEAKVKLDAAAAKEAEYSRLMQSVTPLSARDGVPIVERAAVIRRESEAARNEGAKIDAQADSLKPVLDEVSAIVTQLTNQRKSLDDIEASVNARIAASKNEAAEARASAAAAAETLNKELKELDALRTGELAAQYDKAFKAIKQSVQAAKESQADGGAGGKVAHGLAQLGNAELSWGRAQGAQTYGSLLESLASAPKPLPFAAEIKTRHDAATAEQQQNLQTAKDSFEEARKAFASAKVADKNVTERMQQLGELLETAVKVTGGEEKDVAAAFKLRSARPAAPAPAAAANTPAAPAANATEDQAAIGALIDQVQPLLAAGKMQEALPLIHSTPATKPVLEASAVASAAYAKADAACKAKFKKSAAEILSSNPMLWAALKQMDPNSYAWLSSKDFAVEVTGDRATATTSKLPTPMNFIKVDGKWMVYEAELEAAGPAVAQAGMMVKAMGDVFGSWAAKIEAGEYPTEQAAGMGFMKLFAPVIQKLQNPGGG